MAESGGLDLEMLERDIRSAYLLHEHRLNRYYFDDRSHVGNEPIGGFGFRDDLLAGDALALIDRIKELEADLKAFVDLSAQQNGQIAALQRVEE